MVKNKLYLISYDIAENDVRSQVSEYLCGYGARVNLSVFECMVSDAQLKKIKLELTRLADPKADVILIYRVCMNCFIKAERIGKKADDTDQIVFV